MPTETETLLRLAGLHDKLASCHPSLTRGQVWCYSCGWTQTVSSAHCFKHGWPTCCGSTMSIDSPEERARHAAQVQS